MIKRISDKDKKDWFNFINNKEKLNNKDYFEDEKNKIKLEKSIDLHGYTLDEANKTIYEFILSCYSNNVRKIKVIENECDNLFCITEWNGKDLNSKNINNGTYIYHLKLTHNNNNFEGVYKITKLK